MCNLKLLVQFAPQSPVRSTERMLLGTFAPWNESRELSFQGAKVPGGNFRSKERKYRGAKSPWTVPSDFLSWQASGRGSGQLVTWSTRHSQYSVTSWLVNFGPCDELTYRLWRCDKVFCCFWFVNRLRKCIVGKLQYNLVAGTLGFVLI